MDSKPINYTAFEKALLADEIGGMVVAVRQGDLGWSGLLFTLDRRLGFELQTHLRAPSVITGALGEITYLPVKRSHQTWHFILCGVGTVSKKSLPTSPPTETIQALKKNLTTLKLPRLGISCADFFAKGPQAIEKPLQGIPLWIKD